MKNEKIAIADSDISQILAIPAESLLAKGVLTLANDKKSYVCPYCGNGTGKDGDGIKPFFKDGVYLYNCFKCGDGYNNFHFLAQYYHLDRKKDFIEICRRACIDFGIDFNEIFDADSLIRSGIVKSQSYLNKLPKTALRGLTLETLEHFNCGYLIDWIHPKNIIEHQEKRTKLPPASRRLIIPTSYRHYVAVAIDRNKVIRDYWKQHAGSIEPFGVDDINPTEIELLIIVEGEIDAMSISQAVKNNSIVAVAIGGARQKRSLQKLIKILNKKFENIEKKPVTLILFDPDETGRDSASSVKTEMLNNGYPAICGFLSAHTEKVDANSILDQPNGETILAKKIKDIFDNSKKAIEEAKAKVQEKQDFNIGDLIMTEEQRQTVFKDIPGNTDLDNADRLAFLFGNEFRYIADLDKWANYLHGVWTINPNSKNTALSGIVEKTARTLRANAKTDREKNIAASFQNHRKYSPAITTLKGLSRITITSEDFDKHKNLLNCKNGVVDLETGVFYENHDPKLLLTQCVNAEYKKDFRTYLVDKFLQDIQPDEETRNALLRFVGYAITGEVNEEKFLFIDGRGGNGKGTFTNLLLNIFNNYAVAFPIEGILLNKTLDANAATPAYNLLLNKRLAISEEIPANSKLNASKIKLLTGGDRIPIRRLHEEYTEIKDPTHTMIFSGNNLPEIGDTHDVGILRRLLNIKFTQDFTGNNCDDSLKRKLLLDENRNALLSILVDYAVEWYKNGLIISQAMLDATKKYVESQDFISEFINENCVFGRDKNIPRKAFLDKLIAAYPKETKGFSGQTLTGMVAKIDGVSYRYGTGGKFRFYGIGWQDSAEQDFDDLNTAKTSQDDSNDLPF